MTHEDETITLALTRQSVRSSLFNVKVQNASGGFDDHVPGDIRTYLGEVTEYPDAYCAAYLHPDGKVDSMIVFDRGLTWWAEDGTVVLAPDILNISERYSYPTRPNLEAGLAGQTSYEYITGFDVDHNTFTTLRNSDVAEAVASVEYSCIMLQATQLANAMLKPLLGRIVIRADEATNPYRVIGTGSQSLAALRSAEWSTNHADAEVYCWKVCLSSLSIANGGYAVIGGTSCFCRSDANPPDHVYSIWRHEISHSWGGLDLHAGSPEGPTILCGNGLNRLSAPVLQRFFEHRESHRERLTDVGVYSDVELPPYAALDALRPLMEPSRVQRIDYDVLANDFDANGDTLVIDSFDATSALGRSVELISGAGPDGRDVLRYSGIGNEGFDFFEYTIRDATGKTATGLVFFEPRIEAPAIWSISPSADSYARSGRSETYGSDEAILVKRSSSPGSSFTRTGWLNFDITDRPLYDSPRLRLQVDENNTSGTISIWGIVDGRSGDNLGADWTELTLSGVNAPLTPDFAEDANTTLLGTFDFDTNTTEVILEGAALNDFLAADSNGEVTLLLSRNFNNSNFSIQSREHPSGRGPTLEMRMARSSRNEGDSYTTGGSFSAQNFGALETLEVQNHPDSGRRKRTFLRFSEKVSPDANIARAKLIFTPVSLPVEGMLSVRILDDAGDGWGELEISHDTAPVSSGERVLVPLDELEVGAPVEVSVTELLSQATNQNGIATFEIDAITKDMARPFVVASRENATPTFRPRLQIETGYSQNDDVYIRGGNPYSVQNFGGEELLFIKKDNSLSFTREALLRFDYDAPGIREVENATLTIVPDTASNRAIIRVRLLADEDDFWNEFGITWDDRPSASGIEIVLEEGALVPGVPFPIDVTSLLTQSTNKNGITTFLLDGYDGSIGTVTLHAQESSDLANRPQLEVQLANENPLMTNQTATIRRSYPAGEWVAQMAANDTDPGDRLQFTILGGDSGGEFQIDEVSGTVTTTDEFLHGSAGAYTLLISATDQLGATATANLQVTVLDAVSLESWASSFGLADEDLLPGSDSDFDGLTLVEEYGQNLNPTVSDSHVVFGGEATSGTPKIHFNGNRLIVEFVRRRSDRTWKMSPVGSSDLSQWIPLNTSSEIVVPIDHDFESVLIEDEVSIWEEPYRSVRLHFEKMTETP